MDARLLRLASIVSVALTGLAGSAAADSALLVRPLGDALVVSDPALLDQNYGADPQILVWANYPVYGARSYVEFDLSALPVGETVTFARLNVFQFLGGGYGSGVDVFRVAEDGWSEGTLTWNDQPVLYPDAADLIAQNPTLNGQERGWVSFDLLANGRWDPAVDLAPGDRKLSLILRITGGEVNTQRAHSLCSKDAGPFDCLILGESGPVHGRAPQLVIGTPEPSGAAMLAAGIAAIGLASTRRSAGGTSCRDLSARATNSSISSTIAGPRR
ncbi:MAG: DNRLRE domain-containing protein [Myxococcota bacterium]